MRVILWVICKEKEGILACGKPPDPDRVTPPIKVRNPTVYHANDTMKHVQALIRRVTPGKALDKAMECAQRAIDRAKNSGAGPKELGMLMAQYDRLRSDALGRLRDNVLSPAKHKAPNEKSASRETVLKEFSEQAVQRNAAPIIRAIELKTNWQHEEVKQQLLKIIDSHEKLGKVYREQLVTDVADLLKICPSAAGIVKALTLRGQGEGMTLTKDISNRGNKAIGSAYEIMGTVALGQNASNAGNTKHKAPPLRINVGADHVVFGVKSYVNSSFPDGKTAVSPDRKTIESDIRIGRKTMEGYREIGVDFKHVKDAGSKSIKKDDRNQIRNVAKIIQSGELHEFHFVSNGRFSKGFKEAIDEVNNELVASNNQPIAFHEYVSTLVSDPLADGTCR